MKVRVRVIFPDKKVKEWHLTTEHSQSSYGLPVLVDEKNNPYGPADLPLGTVLRIPSKEILAIEGAKKAHYSVVS